MFENRRSYYTTALKAVQISALIAGYAISLYLYPGVVWAQTNLGELGLALQVRIVTVSIIAYIIFSAFFSWCYARDVFRLPSMKKNITCFVAVLFPVAVLLSFVSDDPDHWIRLGCFMIAAVGCFFVLQFVAMFIVWFINNRLMTRLNVVIVGTNSKAVDFSEYLESYSLLGFRLLGYIDDVNHQPDENKYLGTFKDFRAIITRRVVDVVIIYLPMRSYYDQIEDLLDIAREQGITVCFLNPPFEPKMCGIKPYAGGDVSSVLYYSSPLEDWKSLVKRLFDIAVALIALVFFSPLMIGIALIIFFSDFGPVLFTQERVGYRKRLFTIFKFRTMHRNAHEMQEQVEKLNEMDGPVFKIGNDPRVTRIGHVLRRYGLDELPQLFNVLVGDMSIVGPRPFSLRDYNLFLTDWPRKRFSVRPGITCYWQYSDHRNSMSFEDWMHLDMEYIANWSLLEDVRICLRTIPAILKGTGS
ncbi:MAG: sugar transferase [Desulfovibrionaceae bacterium]